MEDLRLLELAARAAGIELTEGHYFNGELDQNVWNPLLNDAHALRLTVKLHIDVCWNHNEGPWEVNAWPADGSMGSNEEPGDLDACAATRRAIVRAAAAIGKALPCPPSQS